MCVCTVCIVPLCRALNCLQWNPSILAVIIIGVAFIEGLFCTNCSFGTWVLGRYTEVAVKRGSTVV